MVAVQPHRRLVATALIALMTLSTLLMPSPAAATAHEQIVGDPTADPGVLTVRQGEIRIFQGSTTRPTSFIDNSSAVVRFNVYNSGPRDLSTTVYGWLWSAPTNGTPSLDAPGHRTTYATGMFCKAITVPARGPDAASAPGVLEVAWTLDTRDLPDGAYNFTVRVNVPRPSDPDLGFTCPGATTGDLTHRAPGTYARGYFVKGLRVDYAIEAISWCNGDRNSTECDPVLDENRTNGRFNAKRSNYFSVKVVNNGTWQHPLDYGGPSNGTDPFYYELDVRATGPFLNAPVNLSAPTTGVGWMNSANWNYTEKAGWYTVTARVDPLGKLRQEKLDNDELSRRVEIRWVDLTANFTASHFNTSRENPYPFEVGTPIRIKGQVTLRNDGNAEVLYNDTNYTVYLNHPNSTFVVGPVTIPKGTIGPNWTRVIDIDWTATASPGNQNSITPGLHTIYVAIDNFPVYVPAVPGDTEYQPNAQNRKLANRGNETFESDENNNVVPLQIYIDDSDAPTIHSLVLSTADINAPRVTTRHPHQNLSIHVNITDDDLDELNVTALLIPEANASAARSYTLSKVPGAARYHVRVSDLSMVTNASSENWTVRIVASDPSGNNATPVEASIKLIPWPIQNATADWVVMQPADAANFSWGGADHPEFIIRVHRNMTGFEDQPNHTANLWVNYTTPHGTTYGPVSMGKLTTCDEVPAGIGSTGRVTVCNADAPQYFSAFRLRIGKFFPGSSPGEWNVSIHIADRSNTVRTINRTFHLRDDAPVIGEWNWSTNRTVAGGSFNVSVNTTDDFQVKRAHLNFTRINPRDDAIVNLTLPNVTANTDVSPPVYLYNGTFRTGRGELFGLGGTFNATIEAVDDNGNWAKRFLGEFNVEDSLPPVLRDAGAAPALQETGQNITFYARVADETNVTARLQVLRGSEEVFPRATLAEGPDGNLTLTTNITKEGNYLWVIEVEDSLGRVVRREGPLSIRDNIGPRIEIRGPATVIDGQRYASATPRFEFLVFDTEGVVLPSIQMEVAGLPVVPEIVPAGGGIDGYLVSYVVPASKKFGHRDVVDVNLTARDNSSREMHSWLNFTVVVDDVAPIARLTRVTPSYRDQPSQPLNVSLETRFALAAEDNDGLPTQAESIRFRILGGGNNAGETVYTGPFRITDAQGVYTGPRIYQIQFWAEDSVGNVNRTYNVTTIYVDDAPPVLYQFFPQGRFINATFIDDRVGVDRAVVWHRINDAPYRQTPLNLVDGVWSLVLPEGKKGDRVSYYLEAWDRLNNTDTFGNATAPYATFDVSNHEPRIRMTNPVEGSRISRTTDLTWDAADDDHDALVFTIYYRAPGQTAFVELARLENTDVRRYSLDTTRFPDGQYTFRVAASDGGFAKIAETTVTILNQVSAIGVVTPPPKEVVLGESILLKAEITKAQATVEARLFRDEKLVNAFPMNDEGRDGDERARDGVYSVRVPVDAAGEYRVEIFTRYQEDGQTKTSHVSDAAVFTAKLTPRYILAEYAAVLVAIGLLAVVGVGLAVFVVLRRR